ncbi:hypothetical protein MD484_g6412, partial [Candolleomyces efflorescens]
MSEEENTTLIHFFRCRSTTGPIFLRTSAVAVKKTDKVYLVIEAIGRATGALGHVCLWKPNVPLSNSKGAGEISSRLSEAKALDPPRSFDHFCDEVDLEAEGKTVDEVFPELGSARTKARAILVAEILESVQPQERADHDARGDVLTRMRKRLRTTVTASKTATPSVSSKPSQYYDFQGGVAPIIDGRYCSTQNTVGLPVEIYHPAFSHFVAVSRDETVEPPQDILDFTIKLMNAASRVATNEVSRQPTTRGLLSKILNFTVIQTVLLNKSSSDHIVLYTREGSTMLGAAALAVIEEKGEQGTSGEGSVQGSFSYLQHWIETGQKDLMAASFCPSFIISIAGPWLVVLGAVLTSNAVVQRLTDYVWLGHSRVIDDIATKRVARIFTALRQSVAQLKSFYQTLSPSPSANDRFFPLARSYVEQHSSQVISFQYKRPLKQDTPSCVAFLAETSSGRQVVVKFVERYGAEAHQLLADAGRAPALLYCGKIWHNDQSTRDGCYPRKMVVMEYLCGETLEGVASSATRQAVLKAVQHLHVNGLVHGDVRPPNIMIMDGTDGDEGSRVRILDFDWAGREGEARYPYRLSPGLWADGVRDNELILAAHDLEMVQRL